MYENKGPRQEPRLPETMAEALRRKRDLEHDIWSIEQQLTSNKEEGRDRREYQQWRARAHKKLVYTKTEHSLIKDWIKEQRRKVEAQEFGIWDPDDPRELLLKTREVVRRALDGDDLDLGKLYDTIDKFLQHAA